MNLKRYPVLIGGILQTALALAIGLGLPWNARTTGIIEAAIAFGVGLGLALITRPVEVSALTGVINALIIALAAYKVPHVTAGLVSVLDAFIVAVAAMFVHQSVSPVTGRVVTVQEPPIVA